MKEKSLYLCNRIEVVSKNAYAFISWLYPSNGIKISTFLKKKNGDEAEVVQCLFKCKCKCKKMF